MRAQLFLVASMLTAALAGCLEPESDDGDETPATSETPPPPGPQPFKADFNGTGCQESIAVVTVPLAEADAKLPPGYKAKDVQTLLDLPAPTGRGAISINAIQCASSNLDSDGLTLGGVTIYVDAPNVTGNRTAALYDFYDLVHHTTSESLHDLLVPANYTMVLATTITSTATRQATGGATGSASVATDEGTTYTLGVNGPQPATLTDLIRIWHDTSNGTVITDYNLVTALGQGSGSCTVSAGTLAAEKSGITTCPNGQTLGLGIYTEDWTGSIEFLPGVHATP